MPNKGRTPHQNNLLFLQIRNTAIMKRLLLHISVFCLAAAVFCGCEPENPDWSKNARQIDKDTWSVAGIGADITVDLSETPGWRIDGGYRSDLDKQMEASSPVELDCGWFYAWIPENGNSRQMEIWVGVNEGVGKREARIDLSCGTIKRTINIRQKDYDKWITIDWGSRGWDEVFNDLKEPVTIHTIHSEDPDDYMYRYNQQHVIQPGESVILHAGEFAPGSSVRECRITLITLSDGRQMRFTIEGPEIWNRAFLDSFTSEKVRERIKVDDIWVNSIYIIRTYRITPEIVSLWEAAAGRE